MITTPADRLLSTEQAAEILNLRPGTLIAWRSRRDAGAPQFLRLGRRLVRYREDVLRQWIAARDRAGRKAR
jgi:predicted DNA-binding transcriptional regulator AlpA